MEHFPEISTKIDGISHSQKLSWFIFPLKNKSRNSQFSPENDTDKSRQTPGFADTHQQLIFPAINFQTFPIFNALFLVDFP
jgi:hypothetical protein